VTTGILDVLIHVVETLTVLLGVLVAVIVLAVLVIEAMAAVGMISGGAGVVRRRFAKTRKEPPPPIADSESRVHVVFRREHDGPASDVLLDEILATPRLLIDRSEVKVTGWDSTVTVDLLAGRHEIEVAFQAKGFRRFGHQGVLVNLHEGDERTFIYTPRSLQNGELIEALT
jgi:hypothetical protein